MNSHRLLAVSATQFESNPKSCKASFRPGPPCPGLSWNYFREQDLQAARATTPLGRVLGLAHKEALTPQTRDVCLLRRNAVGSAN